MQAANCMYTSVSKFGQFWYISSGIVCGTGKRSDIKLYSLVYFHSTQWPTLGPHDMAESERHRIVCQRAKRRRGKGRGRRQTHQQHHLRQATSLHPPVLANQNWQHDQQPQRHLGLTPQHLYPQTSMLWSRRQSNISYSLQGSYRTLHNHLNLWSSGPLHLSIISIFRLLHSCQEWLPTLTSNNIVYSQLPQLSTPTRKRVPHTRRRQ